MSLGNLTTVLSIDQLPVGVRLLSFDSLPTLVDVARNFEKEGVIVTADEICVALRQARYRTFVLEPVTAMVVLAEIGRGALQWVGGQIMEGIFGNRHKLEQLLQELLENFQKILHRELRREALDAASGRLAGLLSAMGKYGANPESQLRKGTLPIISVESDKLYGEIRRLDLLGLGALSLAANLQLAVVVEAFFLDNRNPAELQNARNLVADFLGHVEKMHDELVRITHHRFSNVLEKVHRTGTGGPDGDHDSYVEFFYKLDGKKVEPRNSDDRKSVSVQRQNHIASLTVKQVQEIIAPSQANADEMRRIVEGLQT